MAGKKKLSNVLFQYKGGGYDGCMWEWNFFAFDKNGKFLNIFTSGYKGVKSAEEAIGVLANTTEKSFSYNMGDESAIAEFQRENNSGNVVSVTRVINKASSSEGYDFPLMWFLCDDCGEKVCQGTMDGAYGDGGIHIAFSDKLCEDCAVLREEAEAEELDKGGE